MMIKEPKAVTEIRLIREKIEQRTKNMNPEELVKYIHDGAMKAARENNIIIKEASSESLTTATR